MNEPFEALVKQDTEMVQEIRVSNPQHNFPYYIDTAHADFCFRPSVILCTTTVQLQLMPLLDYNFQPATHSSFDTTANPSLPGICILYLIYLHVHVHICADFGRGDAEAGVRQLQQVHHGHGDHQGDEERRLRDGSRHGGCAVSVELN